MSDTLTRPKPEVREETETERQWLWNVVLLDDDDHSYEYVIRMAYTIFNMPVEKAFKVAKTVDSDGRAVLLTTHREHAELKQDQIHSFGKDTLIAGCGGSMSAILEPAEQSGDDGA